MLTTRAIARVAAPVAIAEEPSTSSSSSSSTTSSSGAVQPRAVSQVASLLSVVGSVPHVTIPAYSSSDSPQAIGPHDASSAPAAGTYSE